MCKLKAHASPSMVVACISLFVALSGVGYAAATIGSAQIANNAVQSKDIKNGTIVLKDVQKRARASLKGARGATGATGATGAKGAPGTNGTNGINGIDGDDGDDGAPGLARAGARVGAAGFVYPNESFGLGSATVTRPDGTDGEWCIDNLPFTPRVAVANTTIAGGGLNTYAKTDLQGTSGLTSCPAGTDVTVLTQTDANGVHTDTEFYILIN